DHHFRAEPEPRQEHLHLLGGGVLCLVQNNERIVEGTATHVRQRGYLDRARLQQRGNRIRIDHVVQRVVQRTQVRVDLLVQPTRQVPESLPRFDGRAGEDDAVDLL